MKWIKHTNLEVNKEEIIKMFTVDLLPLQAIADKFGSSRMGAKFLLNRYGIDTTKRKYDCPCKHCGLIFQRNKKRIKSTKAIGSFCSNECYIKWLGNNAIYNEPEIKQKNKRGNDLTRRGAGIKSRKIVEKYYGPLPKKCIVHHIDGNDWNLDVKNLMLLDSQKSHMIIHGRCLGTPVILFDGSKLEIPSN